VLNSTWFWLVVLVVGSIAGAILYERGAFDKLQDFFEARWKTITLIGILFLVLIVPIYKSVSKKVNPSGGIFLFHMITDSGYSAEPVSLFLKDTTSNIRYLGEIDRDSPTLISKMLPERVYSIGFSWGTDTAYSAPGNYVANDSAHFVEFRVSTGTIGGLVWHRANFMTDKYVSIQWAQNFEREAINNKPFTMTGANMQSFQGVIAVIFGLLFHAVILLCTILAGVFIYRLVDESASRAEKTIRVLAVLGGLLLFFFSKATGLNISDIMVESISQYSITFILVNTLVPAIIGFVVANFCIKSLKKGENIAKRIIVLFGVLLISQLVDVYITATRQNGFLYSNELLPNISFILAVIFYVIFRYQTEDASMPRASHEEGKD